VGAETSGLATEAATEIARFDAEFGASVMAFAPLLLRSESASSSQIEHLTSSARAIALADLGRTGRSNADLIVSNGRAMQAALDLAERLDGDAILAMHQVLMEPHWPDIAGRWREQQVWIGGSRFGPHEAEFVPPHHDRVPAAIPGGRYAASGQRAVVGNQQRPASDRSTRWRWCVAADR
jgi:hypothetical protein